MMTFNLPIFIVSLAFSWFCVMRMIRQEVRHAILDYANRLKARQFAPAKDPYEAFCDDLHKELARE